MLIQLIYRSRCQCDLTSETLIALGRAASANNKAQHIRGVLLYDGTYFLQVLEGPAHTVDALYARVREDTRHANVVLLLRDPIPHIHFEDFRMNTLDVRQVRDLSGAEIWAKWRPLLGLPPSKDHRSVRIIEAFVRGRWRDTAPALTAVMEDHLPLPDARPDTQPTTAAQSAPAHIGGSQSRFALQPIVHTKTRRITSVEALLRGPHGESPQTVLSAVGAQQLHAFDLHSKGDAIALAAALKLDCILSVNLLPMSLVSNREAVDFLIAQCAQHRWPHSKLLVEVTEEEAITHLDDFLQAVQQLRAAGMQVAIDDFGAGHAGLSLLADFQPDKLKLDKRIIQGVHASGPRQAIVRSVLEFCFCLGITVVAEGVETVEDWSWLQSVGVRRFQGYLFARPQLQGMGPVRWPSPTPAPNTVPQPLHA